MTEINFPVTIQSIFNDMRDISNNISEKVIIIGGFVRDYVINGTSNGDVDIFLEKGQNYSFAEQLANKYGIGKPTSYNNTGTIHLIIDGVEIEIQSSRNPMVHFNIDSTLNNMGIETTWINRNIYERDFTINTIMYDIYTGKIVDKCNGIEDLINNKIIRCPIDPNVAINNNPLIISRAIKFANEFGLKIDDAFLKAAPNYREHFINRINMRHNAHFMKALIGTTFNMNFEQSYEFYKNIGFLEILPIGKDLREEIAKRNLGITIMKTQSENENNLEKTSQSDQMFRHLVENFISRNQYRIRKRHDTKNKNIQYFKLWKYIDKLIHKYKSSKKNK